MVETGYADRRKILKRLGTGFLIVGIPLPGWAAAANRERAWNGFASPPNWRALEVGTGDTLLVPAKVSGTPIQAVLDTGSGASIIGKPLAARLGMTNLEPRRINGLSGKAPVGLVRNVEVELGEQTRVLPFAVVGDLGTISAAYGRPVDMLLGADVLAGGCVALDFGKRRFAFEKSGSFAGEEGWTMLAVGHGAKQELFVLASVASLDPVPLMLDTGSSSALILSSAYVEAHNLLANKVSSTAALGGLEGIQVIKTFTTDRVGLGGLPVNSVPTLGLDRWSSASTVGNVGMPLLGQFDIVLDVAQGRMWLRSAPAHARLPVLKDRSGLGLAPSPTELTVVHISVNSPAAQTGWAVGDRIVSVNGHPIDASYTRESLWKWRYGPAGNRVVLKLADGATRTLELADYY